MINVSLISISTDWTIFVCRSGAYAFQEPHTSEGPKEVIDLAISNTTVRHYLGIDKREGLVTVGKRLLRGQCLGEIWWWFDKFIIRHRPRSFASIMAQIVSGRR